MSTRLEFVMLERWPNGAVTAVETVFNKVGDVVNYLDALEDDGQVFKVVELGSGTDNTMFISERLTARWEIRYERGESLHRHPLVDLTSGDVGDHLEELMRYVEG